MKLTGPNSLSMMKKVINKNDIRFGPNLRQGIGAVSGKPSTGAPIPNLVGKITNAGPNGEDDLTGCKYWVKIQQNNIKAGDLTLGNSLSLADQKSDGQPVIVCAYNHNEYALDSHSLLVNTIVDLEAVYFDHSDGVASPQIRWRILLADDLFTIVQLVKDGGTDGNALTGTPPSWTYTIGNRGDGSGSGSGSTGRGILARQVPLYTNRQWATRATPASWGLAFRVTSNTDIGQGGSYGALPNGGSGDTLQPWRLWWCDEQFLLVACDDDGSGSGS